MHTIRQYVLKIKTFFRKKFYNNIDPWTVDSNFKILIWLFLLKVDFTAAGIDIITEDLLCETTGVLGLSTFSAPTETQDGLKSYNDTSEIFNICSWFKNTETFIVYFESISKFNMILNYRV